MLICGKYFLKVKNNNIFLCIRNIKHETRLRLEKILKADDTSGSSAFFNGTKMKSLLSILKNKYFLVIVFFITWMFFFDSNDIITQYQDRHKLQALEREKAYFQEEIVKVNQDIQALSTDQQHLERFAREKYFMKRQEEDIYVIVEE